MGPSELLVYVVRIFNELRIKYLVTGSTATIFYGEPRFTNDIDIVAAMKLGNVDTLCKRFPGDEFYLSREAVRDAIINCGQFNIIHPASGLKIDLMIPGDNPFNRSRLTRGKTVRVAQDTDAVFASAEDVVVKKLEFYKMGGSEKHLLDIAGVLKIVGDNVDRSYILNWADELGLSDVWETVMKREGHKG